MKINTEQEKLVINVILDGKVLIENLKSTGNDEIWLQKQIISQGFEKVDDILLATCDSNNKLSIYKRKTLMIIHMIYLNKKIEAIRSVPYGNFVPKKGVPFGRIGGYAKAVLLIYQYLQ